MGETAMSNRGIRAPVPTLHDPTPSEEDVRVTREAAQVGDLLGIELLDHVVLGAGPRDFVSLRERGFFRPVSAKSARGHTKTAAGCCRPSWEVTRD